MLPSVRGYVRVLTPFEVCANIQALAGQTVSAFHSWDAPREWALGLCTLEGPLTI